MSVRGAIILNCLSKDKVEMNDVMLVEQRTKEKKIKLCGAANFFQ